MLKYALFLAISFVINLIDCRELNQTILFESFGYSYDSTYIDLNSLGIDSIESTTFNGLNQLEVLHLQNNKLKRIDKDIFKDLTNLRELSLESNLLVAIDKSSFVNLNNLELVCLNNNPITSLFPTDLLSFVCNNPSKQKCFVSLSDKCIRNFTIRPNIVVDNSKLDEFISIVQLDQKRQDDKIISLEAKLDEMMTKFNNTILPTNTPMYSTTSKNLPNISISTIQANNYSISHNISIKELLDQGFKNVFNTTYSTETISNDLINIESLCTKDSVLCVGGSDTADNLLLVSCGNCLNILTPTTINNPNLINGAYWYFTDKKSFGFSPIFSIAQNFVDIYDCPYFPRNCKDSKRLSWSLTGYHGGWRLGILNDDEKSIPFNYQKMIFLK
jgi:hypothetical protein